MEKIRGRRRELSDAVCQRECYMASSLAEAVIRDYIISTPTLPLPSPQLEQRPANHSVCIIKGEINEIAAQSAGLLAFNKESVVSSPPKPRREEKPHGSSFNLFLSRASSLWSSLKIRLEQRGAARINRTPVRKPVKKSNNAPANRDALIKAALLLPGIPRPRFLSLVDAANYLSKGMPSIARRYIAVNISYSYLYFMWLHRWVKKDSRIVAEIF